MKLLVNPVQTAKDHIWPQYFRITQQYELNADFTNRQPLAQLIQNILTFTAKNVWVVTRYGSLGNRIGCIDSVTEWRGHEDRFMRFFLDTQWALYLLTVNGFARNSWLSQASHDVVSYGDQAHMVFSFDARLCRFVTL